MKFISENNRKIFVFILLIAAVSGYLAFGKGNSQSTDNASFDAHVATISPKISGYIKTIYFKDNTQVKEGDLLLEIDPSDYIIKRDRAAASLESAKALLEVSGNSLQTTQISAPSNLDAASAQVAAATANWNKAKGDLNRMQSLSNEARSLEQLDSAVAAEKTAFSNLEDAKARLRSAKTAPQAIASAKHNSANLAAGVKQAEADLKQAEQDLANTKIYASVSGKMTKRNVERGDYIQAAQSITSIVANDFWITANFKETQLKNMRIGDKAIIHIDSFPSIELSGKVESIQAGTGGRFSLFPPENATGNFVKVVQRVPVKITLDSQPPSDLPIGVGMSVVPTVYSDGK